MYMLENINKLFFECLLDEFERMVCKLQNDSLIVHENIIIRLSTKSHIKSKYQHTIESTHYFLNEKKSKLIFKFKFKF